MRYTYTFILLLIISLSSCEVINPDEDIPTFIKIDSIAFTSGFGQGTDKDDIADSWVYVDGDLIGAFEMPCEIPALAAGKHTVMIRPGIKINGIASTRTINPFLTDYSKYVNLVAGETTYFEPTSTYKDYVEFVWNIRGEEDFEHGGISIDSIAGSSTIIEKSTDDVFEGTYSGNIHLDAGHTTYYGESANEFVLPKSGKAIIMEIHVKNNIPLVIGLFSYMPGGAVSSINHLTINPGSEWKKVYVNFTQIVSEQITATTHKIYFKANVGDLTEADIYIDNIKLMHAGN